MTETEEVFQHWKTIMGHSKARLDSRREKVIKTRLRDGYSVDDLKLAIDGCKQSSFHMGQNDRRTVYDGVELIFRSADNVDKFMAMVPQQVVHVPIVKAVCCKCGEDAAYRRRGILYCTTHDPVSIAAYNKWMDDMQRRKA